MAGKAPITVAFYGFSEEQEPFIQAAFAHADKWPRPWQITQALEKAHVVIVSFVDDSDFTEIDQLKQDLPNAEIIVFSAHKPSNAQWHLERLASGKFSTLKFSQLILKIANSLKRNLSEAPNAKANTTNLADNPNQTAATSSPKSVPEEIEQEPEDLLSFFDQLDSLMDSKPNEKRKRFNEK